VGAPLPHDSAHLHVTGEALYTDDIPEVRGTLHAAIGMSERAHARIKSIDLTKVRAAPGVVAVLTAKDVPGKNDYGPVVADPISRPRSSVSASRSSRSRHLRRRGASGATRSRRVRGPEPILTAAAVQTGSACRPSGCSG
jgi:CO/xanthine dehydrogenase Mo-binding subunit